MKTGYISKMVYSAAFILIISFAATPLFSEEVSLEKFLLLVQANNKLLKASSSRLESTYYSVRSAVAPQRPSFGIQGTTNSVTSETAENTISAGVNQRIDIAGVYPAQESSAIYGYKVQAETHRDLANSVLSSAEALYWQAIMALENVDLYRNILNQRQENLRITKEQYRQDLIPMLDVIRAEARVEESRSLLTQARSGYNDLLAQIRTITGGMEVIPMRTSLTLPEIPTVKDLEKTCSHRPDIRSLEFALKKARTDLTLASKGLSPTLDAFLGWTTWSDTERVSPPEDEILLSLTVNIPITDGSLTRNRIKEREYTIAAAESELDARRDTAREEITLARNRWEQAAAVRKNKEKQAHLAEEELRITTLLYKEGLGSQLELLNAQTEQVRASTELLDAIKELYLALVDMKRACGTYALEYIDKDAARYQEW
jgi:outer membrane protein TolC